MAGDGPSRRPLQKAASVKNSQLPVAETTSVMNSLFPGAFNGILFA
jgi:hypothetical protein